jgi:hypothetical protein
MRKPSLLRAAAALLIVCGCRAAPEPAPFKPVADVKQVMMSITDPAADVVWGAVATIEDKQGVVEIAPKNDEEWAAVRNAAYAIAESGNLLMMEGRARDKAEWMRLSRQLVEIGMQAVKAAEAKDKDKVFEVGGEIYGVCSSCHEKYQPR